MENDRALLHQEEDIDELVPVAKRDESVVLQALLFSHEVQHGDDHDGVNHHLVEHASTHFEVRLGVQEVNHWPKGSHTDEAEREAVNEVLVISVGFNDCLQAAIGERLLGKDDLVGQDLPNSFIHFAE